MKLVLLGLWKALKIHPTDRKIKLNPFLLSLFMCSILKMVQ